VAKQKNLNKKAYQSLLLSGVLWGFVPLFYKKSLLAVSIVVFLALRFTFAAAFIFATERKKFISIKPKMLAAIIGFAFLDMLMINLIYSVGIQKTTILHAAIIQLINPFLVYVFAAILLKEKPHKVVLMGSTVAVAGLLIIVITSLDGSSAASSTVVGDLILIAGAALGAFTVVLGRKLLSQKKRIPPEQLGFIEYAVCAVPFIAIATATSSWGVLTTISVQVWLWILAASIISGAIPVIMYYRTVRRLPAERLADISFVIPAVSGAVGILFMGEQLTMGFIIGTSLVVAGLLVSHKKIHPILIAHHIGADTKLLQSMFRMPKRAYAYIAVETKSTFNLL
jgi:drug/metabolite transporter (DMT)-like permease